MHLTTPRLLLRDGTPDDAEELAAAVGHWDVARMLERLPWPYGVADARWWLAQPKPADRPEPLIVRRDTGAILGCVGIMQKEAVELGYWLTPAAWGRGFATEAAGAMVAHGRDTLRLERIASGHFVDNPASGRVLAKVGFRPTGVTRTVHCVARSNAVPFVEFVLQADGGGADGTWASTGSA